MAAAVAMELDQCETSKKTAGALAISKSSGSRISKPNSGSTLRKNPIMQQQQQQQQQQGGGGNKPAPTSKVYNTDPMSFRNLVQQLTGCDPAPAPPPPPPPPTAPVQSAIASFSSQLGQPQLQPIQQQPQIEAHNLPQYHHQQQQQQRQQQQQQQQQQMIFPDPAAMLQQGSPTSSGGGGGFSSGARPVNTRLQRMAPPPLRPTFSFSLNKLQQQIQPQQQQQGQQGQGQDPKSQSEISSPGAHPLSPISKRVSPMPLLSFSPLPVLSPTDNAWASFESPNTAAMKQLAQSILEGKSSSTISGRFPWSPLGLPSPGLMPELFPDVKMIDSPQQDSATAATSATADFSFPELRDS